MGLLTISTPPPEHEPPVPETDDVVLAEDSLLYEIAVHEQSRLRADVGDSPDAARIDGEHSVVVRYREVRQADIRRRMTTYKYLIAAELFFSECFSRYAAMISTSRHISSAAADTAQRTISNPIPPNFSIIPQFVS